MKEVRHAHESDCVVMRLYSRLHRWLLPKQSRRQTSPKPSDSRLLLHARSSAAEQRRPTEGILLLLRLSGCHSKQILRGLCCCAAKQGVTLTWLRLCSRTEDRGLLDSGGLRSEQAGT